MNLFCEMNEGVQNPDRQSKYRQEDDQAKEAKQQMVLEGRLKMNEVIGCGKLEVFTELKQHFGTDEAHSHISIFAEKK